MGGPEVVLRARVPEDADLLGRLLLEQQPLTSYPVRAQPDPASFVVRPTQVAAWVVEVDGEVAGHVALGRVAAEHGFASAWSKHHGVPVDELLCVSALFVAVGRTGLGLGGLLFDHAVSQARGHGNPPVLDTIERPSAALTLYRRRGWTVVAHAEQDWVPGGVMTVAMVPPPL